MSNSLPQNIKSSSRFAGLLNAFCNGYQPPSGDKPSARLIPKDQPLPPPEFIPRTAFDNCQHDYEFLERSGNAITFYCRRCTHIQTREI